MGNLSVRQSSAVPMKATMRLAIQTPCTGDGACQDRRLGDGDVGGAGGADCGVKDIFPTRSAGGAAPAFNVKTMFSEAFINRPRVDFKGIRRGSEFVLRASQRRGGAWF